MGRRISVYLHSDKYKMYEIGYDHGLRGEALEEFQGALYELEVVLDVNPKTGKYTIIETKE